MRPIVFSFIGASMILGVALVSFTLVSRAPGGEPLGSTTPTAVPELATAYPDVDHPREELMAMRFELSMLRESLLQLAQEQGNPPREQSEPALAADVEAPPRDEAEEEAKRTAQIERFSHQLASEGRDEPLGRSLTADLRTAFEEGGFDDVTVYDAQCGTTLCRLELNYGNDAADAAMQLPYLMPWAGEGFTHEGPQDRVVVYAAREGERLPR